MGVSLLEGNCRSCKGVVASVRELPHVEGSCFICKGIDSAGRELRHVEGGCLARREVVPVRSGPFHLAGKELSYLERNCPHWKGSCLSWKGVRELIQVEGD